MANRRRHVLVINRRIRVQDDTPTPPPTPPTLPDITLYTGKLVCKGLTEEQAQALLSQLVEIKTDSLVSMFEECTAQKLEIKNVINCNNLADVHYMLRNCRSLEEISGAGYFDIPKANYCYNLFSGCSKLKKIDMDNIRISHNTTSAVTTESMFENCSDLEEVTNLYISLSQTLTKMFSGCSKLKRVVFKQGSTFGGSNTSEKILYFSSCTALTEAAIVEMANSLGTPLVEASRKISFANAVYDSLSAETIALFTAKGYTVIRG